MDLLECRNKLDVIDKKIVKLFEERMDICGKVAETKIASGKAVYDAEREKQKLRRSVPWQAVTLTRSRCGSCSPR